MNTTSASPRPILVLGGTGFLGRHVVATLLTANHPVRIGTRHRETAHEMFGGRAEAVHADVRDEASIEEAVSGAAAVVNAVSLYAERRDASFRDVHVDGARRVAGAAARRDLRLVHMSGIGADPHAANAYIAARGRGEEEVRQAHPHAHILRSAAMVGPNDALMTTIVVLVRTSPMIPLFGRGRTKLQPVHVEDVAEAVAALATGGGPELSELGGPRAIAYRDLLKEVARRCGTSPVLVPMPFAVWRAVASAGRFLPRSPVDAGQVALMERDNVVAPELDLRAAIPLSSRDSASVLAQMCR